MSKSELNPNEVVDRVREAKQDAPAKTETVTDDSSGENEASDKRKAVITSVDVTDAEVGAIDAEEGECGVTEDGQPVVGGVERSDINANIDSSGDGMVAYSGAHSVDSDGNSAGGNVFTQRTLGEKDPTNYMTFDKPWLFPKDLDEEDIPTEARIGTPTKSHVEQVCEEVAQSDRTIGGAKNVREELIKEWNTDGNKVASWRPVQAFIQEQIDDFLGIEEADERPFSADSEFIEKLGGVSQARNMINKLVDQFHSPEVTRKVAARKIAAHIMPKVEIPDLFDDYTIPLTAGKRSSPDHYSGYIAGGEKENLPSEIDSDKEPSGVHEHYQGTDGFFHEDGYIPESMSGTCSAALTKENDVIGALKSIKEELNREYPGCFDDQYNNEGLFNPIQDELVSVAGKVVNMFTPMAHNQKQVFIIADKNGNLAKVTVWNRADVEKYGMDTLGTGVADWTDGTDVPEIAVGDIITIKHASVDWYNGQLTLACTQESELTIVEEGDGECIVSPRIGGGRVETNIDTRSDETTNVVTFEKDSPEDFDDGEAVPIPRIRNREVTRERQGEFVNARTIGIGNMAFHSNVAYDGSYNHGADNMDGSPKMTLHDETSQFSQFVLPDELPVDASDLDEVSISGEEPSLETELTVVERYDSLLRDEAEVRSTSSCDDCGEEHNIKSSQLQKGGADESMTALYECVECGNVWTEGY